MRLPSAATIERDVLDSLQVRRGCERVADEVAVEARELAARRAWDLGTYAARIRRQFSTSASQLVVAEDRKSRWLEQGTGIYGPRRTPIRPKRGKFLVFRVREAGSAPLGSMSGQLRESGLIFAREVKGRPASWVMRDAARRVAARWGLRLTENLRE